MTNTTRRDGTLCYIRTDTGWCIASIGEGSLELVLWSTLCGVIVHRGCVRPRAAFTASPVLQVKHFSCTYYIPYLKQTRFMSKREREWCTHSRAPCRPNQSKIISRISTFWSTDARHPASLWYLSVAWYILLDGDRFSHAQSCANLTGSHIDHDHVRLTIMSGWGDMLLIRATKPGVIFSSAYQTGCCFTCAGCKRSRGEEEEWGGGRSLIGCWRHWFRATLREHEMQEKLIECWCVDFTE